MGEIRENPRHSVANDFSTRKRENIAWLQQQ
jgi:hypothetical protein